MEKQSKILCFLTSISTALIGVAVGFDPYSRLLILLLLMLPFISYRRQLYVAIRMLPRDLRLMYQYGKIMWRNKVFEKHNTSVVKLFQDCVTKQSQQPCFIFEDKIWTLADVDKFSNRVAQVFLAAGYKKGDVVGLFMTKCPEYVCIWLGLAKLGVVTALINVNLRSQTLIHSLNAAKIKGVIIDEELSFALLEVVGSLDYSLEQYQLGGKPQENSDVKSLNILLSSVSNDMPNTEEPGYNDILFYMYTSGTTGLPKAALIPHSRYMLMAVTICHFSSLCSDDRIYNPLPLYHGAGGVVGTGPALIAGVTVVLKKKFSASSYWTDCIKYNCTVGQYIGELCRYLLSVPPQSTDSSHHVRAMIGNGLRSTVWKDFVQRFNVKQVLEVYASTEGTISLANISNKIGAIGYLPKCFPSSLLPIGLIRVNPDTYEPIRSKNGLCIRSKHGEPGMAVGVISSSNAIRTFHGYIDKSASKKKILHDVFKKGDTVFISGDILVMDEYGYIYFNDRTGDSFRWKGENVSTTEVESLIMDIIGLKDTIVYGVEIPGYEGRVGMVAIADPDNTLDFEAFAEGVDKSLPSYAQPLFVRVVNQLHKTETFKIKKYVLQKEGFDPSKIKDKLYFQFGKKYIPLTFNLYQDILKGVIRI